MSETVRQLMVRWQEEMDRGATEVTASRFQAERIVEIMSLTDEMEVLAAKRHDRG